MADEENLNIRISELPETNVVDKDTDYLPVVKESTLYTSGYQTFKVTPAKLLAEAAEYTAGDHIAISSDNEISATYKAGTNITIDADGTISATGGGSGSTVEVTQIQTTGTKIATITVDSVGTDLYAPNGGGGASALDDLSDVNIDTSTLASGQVIKYDGTSWVNGTESGGGSTVSVTQIQSAGTKIATITVDSVDTDLYAPNGGGGASAFEDLTDVDIDSSTLANGQVPVYNSNSEKWENGTLTDSIFTDVTGTLTSGSTSITLQDASITTTSTINVYTDGGVDYNSITVATGSVTLTFDAQASDLPVKVRVWTTPPTAEGSSF